MNGTYVFSLQNVKYTISWYVLMLHLYNAHYNTEMFVVLWTYAGYRNACHKMCVHDSWEASYSHAHTNSTPWPQTFIEVLCCSCHGCTCIPTRCNLLKNVCNKLSWYSPNKCHIFIYCMSIYVWAAYIWLLVKKEVEIYIVTYQWKYVHMHHITLKRKLWLMSWVFPDTLWSYS